MNPDIPISHIIIDWPEVFMEFIEYSGGDVAVAVQIGDVVSAGTVCQSFEDAICYATGNVRFIRAIHRVKETSETL